jgi:hypothetical protein
VYLLYSVFIHDVSSQLALNANEYFLWKLLLSFIVGSTWITTTTILADKFGARFGGLVAGIPSTIVISLFFVGWTQTPLIASQATTPVPLTMGITAVFVVGYVLLSRYNFYFALITSLSIWAVLALILAVVRVDNFLYSWIGFIVLLATSQYILSKNKAQDDAGQTRKNIRYTPFQLLFRGTLSGAMIAFAVIMVKIGGPFIGGIFVAFPVVMLSVIIITYLAQGKSFSCETAKVLMISGTITVVLYATTARFAFLHFGLIYGTLLSFIVGLISANVIRLFLRIKMS